MRKHWVPVLLMWGVSTVHAQSSVTLYGVIDEGLNFNSNQGGHRSYMASDNDEFGSRWGLRGTEDLGGGLKALFILESGFHINTGTMAQGNRLFGRQALVGMSSNYGTITLGRQIDVEGDYVTPNTGAALFGTFGGHPMDNDNLQIAFRISNAVKFRTASYGGFSAESLYAFSNAIGDNQNKAWSLGGGYTGGPLSLGASVLKLDHPSTDTTGQGAVGSSGSGTTSDFSALANVFLTGAINGEWIIAAAGSYKFGRARLYAGYTHVKYEMTASNVWFNNIECDASYFITPFLEADAGYTYTDGKVDITDIKPKYHQFNAMLKYFLSKSTHVYLQSIYQRAAGDALHAQIFTESASSNKNQLLVRLGIGHTF